MEFGESTPKNTIESKERFGRNVEVHILFTRHGEKNESGNLTPKGREQAHIAGESMEKKDAIKGDVAPIQRVIDTVDSIVRAAPHDKKMNIRTRTELGYQASPDFVRQFRSIEAQGGDTAPQWFLDFGEERPDQSTLSPHEVAEQLASLVEHYAELAKRLYSGSKIDWVLGTQQALPEALLKEVLLRTEDDTKISGFQNLAEIGGALRFAEMIDFEIKTDNDGGVLLKINFRGKKYDVDVDKLHQLAIVFRDKQNNEK
ncbi:histidine phosphatase family protein [bacterium]|nr:histidine phosphatase family protein [bacterium]